MVRKLKQRTLNRELVRQSLLTALQTSYQSLNSAKRNQINATFINSKGFMSWLGDPEIYADRIMEATSEYTRNRYRYDGYVKLMDSGATDEELIDFLENGNGQTENV